MNQSLLTNSFSLLCPWLVLVRALQWVAGDRISGHGPVRLAVLGVSAIGILAVPVRGFTVAGWVRGIEANFSIPFMVLLAAGVWENEFAWKPFTTAETLEGWAFGVVGGLALYPLALGLGKFDPYEWGWRFSPLFVAIAALTVLLIWKQSRFGLVLLLAAFAYNAGILESNNYWDYLLDPVYFVVALAVLFSRPFARVPAAGAACGHATDTPVQRRSSIG